MLETDGRSVGGWVGKVGWGLEAPARFRADAESPGGARGSGKGHVMESTAEPSRTSMEPAKDSMAQLMDYVVCALTWNFGVGNLVQNMFVSFS